MDSISRGNSKDIIGEEFSNELFGAAYEYPKSADGNFKNEVMIFPKKGRVRAPLSKMG